MDKQGEVEGEDNVVHWNVEENILKDMRADARKKCLEPLRELSECTRDRTITLLWACSKFNRAFNECVKSHSNAEEMERRKKEWIEWSRGHKLQTSDVFPPEEHRKGHGQGRV